MKATNKKIVTIVAIALLLIAAIVIGFVVYRKRQAQSGGSTTDDIPSGGGSDVQTLQYGSRGDEVKRLQTYLNSQLQMLIWKGLPTYNDKEIKQLDVDGIFGARTQAVVKWLFGTTSVQTNQF